MLRWEITSHHMTIAKSDEYKSSPFFVFFCSRHRMLVNRWVSAHCVSVSSFFLEHQPMRWPPMSNNIKSIMSMIFTVRARQDEIEFAFNWHRLASSLSGDIIQENFIDSYNNLTLKTILMLKWANNNCVNKGERSVNIFMVRGSSNSVYCFS